MSNKRLIYDLRRGECGADARWQQELESGPGAMPRQMRGRGYKSPNRNSTQCEVAFAAFGPRAQSTTATRCRLLAPLACKPPAESVVGDRCCTHGSVIAVKACESNSSAFDPTHFAITME
jgi:hypothetical protein